MRMLWRIQGVSMRDRIGNEEIREAATVQPMTTYLMQKRLRWYLHARRIDDSHGQNRVGHGGRRCETRRKTNIKIYGQHQKRHE